MTLFCADSCAKLLGTLIWRCSPGIRIRTAGRHLDRLDRCLLGSPRAQKLPPCTTASERGWQGMTRQGRGYCDGGAGHCYGGGAGQASEGTPEPDSHHSGLSQGLTSVPPPHTEAQRDRNLGIGLGGVGPAGWPFQLVSQPWGA